MMCTALCLLMWVVSAEALVVRYASLFYDLEYKNVDLPFLASSMCQVEAFVAPSLPVKYVIYVNNMSEDWTKMMLSEVFSDTMPRISFLNLDKDPNDQIRMAAYQNLSLDDKNLASVRRMLADVERLPAAEARLLLGTDFSFLRPPENFFQLTANTNQVVYMMDDHTFGGKQYKLRDYEGLQCKGLLGDMFYIPSGMQLSLKDAHSSLKWYMDQPIVEQRTDPPCSVCVTMSDGLHAMDQFAWAILLGKASSGQCAVLDSSKYHHSGYSRVKEDKDVEGVHQKKTRCPKKTKQAKLIANRSIVTGSVSFLRGIRNHGDTAIP